MNKTEQANNLRIKPAWMKHEKQVLRYTCFYKEPVLDSTWENFRVRRLTLSYYLEDGTLQLSEPSIPNCGLTQGMFLRRHKVTKPNGDYVQPTDLACGRDLDIYSRTYRIVSMDVITRAFYERSGLDPGEEIDAPCDPFSLRKLEEIENACKPLPADVIRAKALVNVLCGGSELNRKVKQYLDMDGKILRFFCYWDDTSEDGFRHMFQLHYFLADDSIEIIEIFPQTDSCAPERCVFLKRGFVKKSRTGPTLSDDDSELISLKDLCSESLCICNREFHLYDSDPFTRKYFQDTLGIKLRSTSLQIDEKPAPSLPLPPPTGFGTEEDTLASCDRTRIVPRRPRIDPRKLEHSGVILRFEVEMANPRPNDEGRKFILGFYPSDSSIAVWEAPVRNSGIIGGKFAERGPKKRPVDGTIYSVDDLQVGKIVTVSCVDFRLVSADNFTIEWLKKRTI